MVDMAALIERVRSRGPDQVEALRSLRDWLGRHTHDMLDALVDALDSDDDDVRCQAAWCIRLSLPYPSRVQEALCRTLLEDSGETVREHCADGLGRLAPQAEGTLRALAETLRHEDSDLRLRASMALEWVGPMALRSGVLESREDESEMARCYQALARWRITTSEDDGDALVSQIFESLPQVDDDGRVDLIYLLGLVGSEMKRLPEIAEYLTDELGGIRSMAARSIGSHGARARPYRERLLALASDPDERVRKSAADAVTQIDEDRPDKAIVRYRRDDTESTTHRKGAS